MTLILTRLFAPSVARNRDPILEVLRQHVPAKGLVLEIASGTGEHAVHFAQHLGPDLIFQPTDPDAEARASIDAWVDEVKLPNVRPAIAFDVSGASWPLDHADVVLCINMIHISPWEATVGLVSGSGRIVPRSGKLILYGPYRRDGRHTAPSNEAFDLDLRARNESWGIRDLEAVVELAKAHGFKAPVIKAMPANNLTLIFERDG
jgi:Protein of unknown function (DUF938)